MYLKYIFLYYDFEICLWVTGLLLTDFVTNLLHETLYT